MSDYTKTTNFTLKDSTNAIILGADFETEFSAVANSSTTKANKVGSPTTDNIAKLTGTGDLADSGLSTAKTPQVDETVQFEKVAGFDAEVATGSGGSVTFTWANGNKQSRTLTSAATFTFTSPGVVCNLVLKILNSGAARTITWPASVKWPGGVIPAPSGSGKYDIYSFYWDGTNYWGAASLNY